MIDDPAIRHAMNERAELLARFYEHERSLGVPPLEANEAMHFFAKRLDAAAQRVADDAYSRDLAVLRSVMERSR